MGWKLPLAKPLAIMGSAWMATSGMWLALWNCASVHARAQIMAASSDVVELQGKLSSLNGMLLRAPMHPWCI
eukprot:5655322-Pyramimonas_sp.AAC.1